MPDELLERDEERAAIETALRDARHGDGGVLVIEAAAGLGKSRLLNELRGSAAGTMRVLTARAGELEQSFAFGVVRQLFEAVVRDPELGPVATAGAAASACDVFDERAPARRRRWPTRSAPNSPPAASSAAPTRRAAPARSRRASGGWPASPPPAAPTARSRRSCS